MPAWLPELETGKWLVLFFTALMIGMAKGGVKGLGMLVIPLMAATFGGRMSTGLIVPLLNFGDIFAVSYYNRHAHWKYIWRSLPAAIAGVLVAIWVGYALSDQAFDAFIAGIIILSLFLMILQERIVLGEAVTGGWWFGSVFGFLGGFFTMIANAAGPIITVYLLSTRIPKNSFIGTGAWIFMIINLFKVPFHILVWKTINWQSFLLDLLALPFILPGVWLGVKVIRILPEKGFRYFVMGVTLLISLKLIFG